MGQNSDKAGWLLEVGLQAVVHLAYLGTFYNEDLYQYEQFILTLCRPVLSLQSQSSVSGFSYILSVRLFPPHFMPQTPLLHCFPIPVGQLVPCLAFQSWVHVEGIKTTTSPWVTHTRKLPGLGLNDLDFFSLPELAGNCMWADWARNGLNDQLEGKRSCFLYSSRVPAEELYFPSHAHVGPCRLSAVPE